MGFIAITLYDESVHSLCLAWSDVDRTGILYGKYVFVIHFWVPGRTKEQRSSLLVLQNQQYSFPWISSYPGYPLIGLACSDPLRPLCGHAAKPRAHTAGGEGRSALDCPLIGCINFGTWLLTHSGGSEGFQFA